jgi:thioredoxin reductase
VNGFLTRDGTSPHDLRRVGREQLARYPNVKILEETATDAVLVGSQFEVKLERGDLLRSRKLLIATGLEVQLPAIDGLEELYGHSVFDCPYCDGWELAGTAIAVYGKGEAGKDLALELRGWSDDVCLFTHGECGLTARSRSELELNGIKICEERLSAVSLHPSGISIRSVAGNSWTKSGMFFIADARRVSPLLSKLGCESNERGVVDTGLNECTDITGLYVAGDASKQVSFAIVAAAEGAIAAVAINQELLREDRLPPLMEKHARSARVG